MRRALSIVVFAALAAFLCTSSSRGDLAGRFADGQRRANNLQSQIGADSRKIHAYQGRIADLQARLKVLERAVAIQQRLLREVTAQLNAERARLASLRRQYAQDRVVLAEQLVANYESPRPTLVDVVLNARGFDDLLNRMSRLKTIARANAHTVTLVNAARVAVAAETRRLIQLQGRRKRATAAVVVERDQVANLKLAIVGRELAVARDRGRKARQLRSLRATLAREAATLARQARLAQAAAFAVSSPPAGGCANSPFVPHGGQYGFFPAAGTNYSVGQEPIIAARLDVLGRALGLHLIGVSGYRTPQHSVEVGGFSNDPHTRGIASDTPGVEGVPEATLLRFCLTRPFGGAREADHIQEG